FLIIGLVAGWLAGQFVKGSGFGMLGDIIIGVVGAFIGGSLFRMLGLTAGGLIGSLVMATIGAIVLIVILRAGKRVTHRTSYSGTKRAGPPAGSTVGGLGVGCCLHGNGELKEIEMGLFDFVGNIGKKLFGPKETKEDAAAKIKAEIESGNLGIKDLQVSYQDG